MTATPRDPWLMRFAPHPAAAARFVCFGPAGSGPSFFRRWAGLVPAEVELLVAQLPAREARLAEAAVPEIGALADALAGALAGALERLAPRPMVLFGHSMGALLAYEVAHRLAGWPAPLALMVAGREAPDVAMLGPHGFLDLPDAAFMAEVARRYGGVPEAVLAEPELVALVAPGVRADLRAVAGYREAARPALSCPLLVLHGLQDALTAPGRIEGWCARTTGPARLRAFAGGHFFVSEAAAEIVAEGMALLGDAGGR
jgi:medium-chain acyl-[acyl-carrier-protein] hydrolase